ncbi:MAG: patatin-like phospholipase family protein [Acidimicrobiaceae bacterium]|nr:patatin-like phospholipase family protein [Acidimicrobiaceae bacterium]
MLGAAEVGMLQALVERDVVPDLVVGSSVGAINGALLAVDPSPAGVARLSEAWAKISGRRIFTGSLWDQVGNLVRHGTYLHTNDGLRTLLDDELGPAEFADLRVPFECVAACIERAEAHWFSSGPVVPAVLASCAVPGLLPAVELDGEHFVDGGLVRSVPVGRAAQRGARRIFVLHVGRIEANLRPPTNPWEVALLSFEIARRHHFAEEVALLPEHVELHVLPAGSSAPALSLRYRSFSEITDRIDAARTATGSYLDRAGI